MNQQDYTMMIAAQVVAALAAQTGENIYDPIRDEDYVPDESGAYRKHKAGHFYVYRVPFYGSSAGEDSDPRYSLGTTYEDRIARYAAQIADKTVHAVQRELNKP